MSHTCPENGNTAENIFKILNQVLETGTPATVVLKGKRLLISPNHIVSQASAQSWTRDPFNRLITAHAALNGNILITKDETIQHNYVNSAW